jgi:hypothetical protein
VKSLLGEMLKQGLDENAANRAMELESQRGKYQFMNQRKVIKRRH